MFNTFFLFQKQTSQKSENITPVFHVWKKSGVADKMLTVNWNQQGLALVNKLLKFC